LVLALVFWVYRQSIGPCVALYKRELGKLPILGGLQRYAGNIPVARSGDVEAAKRSLGEAAVRAREGYHVSGFPEGSRRRTLSTGKRDQIQTLKKGFFHLISELAREKPVEVYPVVYVGSYRSWPIGSVLPISGSQVTVRVGDPILVENDQVDMEVLRSQVSDRLETELIMSGSPCVSEAFQRGYEMNFFKIFGVELILSVVPFLGALICYLGS
jgi:1-acyl-sn-glycerol-3-phosphate acyltransferase